MRRFDTILSIIALGLLAETGTSCKKETASPVSSNSTIANPNVKLNQQDSTSTMGQSGNSNDHGCGNGSGDHGGQGGYGY